MDIIDISKFQTVTNWESVKANVEGVIIRIGYRGYHQGSIVFDPKYKEFRKAVEEKGIPHSFYFFPCSISDREANEEADFIIKELAGLKLAYPVFLDSEVAEAAGNGRADKLSKVDRTRFLKIIMDRLIAAGIKTGVYASTSWFKDHLNDNELKGYTHWVAQYGPKLTYKGDYMLWQYTSKGKISGITGNVDISRKNANFGAITTPNKKEEINMPTIKEGSRGKAVKIWQIIIGVSADGIFGANTEAATKTFQKNNGLVIDGIVGPKSWKTGLESV